MCDVPELERHKDIITMNLPEAWACRMALEIPEDRNNHIRRQGNNRMLGCPPISEHTIASHVVDLLGGVRFSECIGDIDVP
jgi:hypothetical protein